MSTDPRENPSIANLLNDNLQDPHIPGLRAQASPNVLNRSGETSGPARAAHAGPANHHGGHHAPASLIHLHTLSPWQATPTANDPAHPRFPSYPYGSLGPRLVSMLMRTLRGPDHPDMLGGQRMIVHLTNGTAEHPLVLEVPSLLDAVTEKTSVRRTLTVLVENQAEQASGFIASPRLVPYLHNRARSAARLYRGDFAQNAMSRITAESVRSNEVQILFASFKDADGHAYDVYATQLGHRNEHGRWQPGPLKDCEDTWPPPKTVTWQIRLHREQLRETEHGSDFYILLHCRSDLRSDLSFWQ